MKSKTIYLAFLFFCFFAFSFLSIQKVSAQCQVVVTDLDGNVVSITDVSCDFPVKIETADPAAGNTEYATNKENYKIAHPADFDAYGQGFSYMIIHQADLDAMPASKRDAILADPAKYHIEL
jgi:hypothetical protein